MRKTLLLTAALACSGVAQAETYVCTSTYGIFTDAKKILDSTQSTWIADTSECIRRHNGDAPEKSYVGECEKNSDTHLACSSITESRIDTILINTTYLTFTGATLMYDSVWARSGKCVEI